MLEPTVMVIVELPEPGAGIVLGLKLTVVPEGAPVAVRLMALLNPPLMAVVIVELPWVPCTTLSEAGVADTVKLGEDTSLRRRIQALLLASLTLTKMSSEGK